MYNSLKSAIEAVMASVPQVKCLMTCGAQKGFVAVASSRPKSVEDFSGVEPVEGRRLMCLAEDFPNIAKGSVVTVDDNEYIVIEVTVDPVGATQSVSVSASFRDLFNADAEIYGADGVRGVVKVGARFEGTVDATSDMSIGSDVKSIRAAFPCMYWKWSRPPRVGDTIRIQSMKFKGVITSVESWTPAGYVITCEED